MADFSHNLSASLKRLRSISRKIMRLCREELLPVSSHPSNLARCAVGALAPLLIVAAATLASGSAAARPAPESFAELAEKLLPSVVNISTTQTLKSDRGRERAGPEVPQFPPGSPFEEFFRDFFDRGVPKGGRPEAQPRKATSLGSGFIIDPAGYVVTNNHVIADADEITVILHDDTNLKAELVGRDTKTDIALLKVKTDKPLSAATWGDSDASRVGDWVLAIGNPFGLGGSVTAGILSARQRTSIQAPMTISCRPMPRSIAAIPAGRCSTWTARSSASTRRSIRLPAARSGSASPFRRLSPRRSSPSWSTKPTTRCIAAGSGCVSRRSPTRSPKVSGSTRRAGR
jgi:hypothetical protein